MLTRLSSPYFTSFKNKVNVLLLKNSNLMRLDCLNPIVALNKLIPINLPNPENQKLEQKDVLNKWLKAYKYSKINQFGISMGVRDSLTGLFRIIQKQNKTILIPNGIYPVYKQIAYLTNVNFIEYKLDQFQLVFNTSATILITFNHLYKWETTHNFNMIYNWLISNTNNFLIIDCVYAYTDEFTKLFEKLLSTNQVVILHSLSKSHLLPLHFGVNITQNTNLINKLDKYIEKPTHDLLNNSFNRLSLISDLPLMQTKLFTNRWNEIRKELKNKNIDLNVSNKPINYMTNLNSSFDDLLVKNILSVDESVFSENENTKEKTIVSCLYNILDNNIPKVSIKMYYVTVLANFAKAYDKYSRIYDKKHISESTFSDKFYLVPFGELEIGINKATKLLEKLKINNNQLLVIETNISEQLNNTSELTSKGYYINKSHIVVHKLHIFENNVLIDIAIEDAYAKSMLLNNIKLYNYNELQPRTISILPIAKGCQAKCPFCFSHSSISDDQPNKKQDFVKIENILKVAKENGAERAVITGGGEPFMLNESDLLHIINLCSQYYKTVVIITNGFSIGKLSENDRLNKLLQLQKVGLTVLSVSKHGYNSDVNKKIMYLDTQSDKIAKTISNNKSKFIILKFRFVCVLQKGGVEDIETLKKYLDMATLYDVKEICFKELYVATSHESVYYNKQNNIWSQEHQISLNLVLNFVIDNGGIKLHELPWGSPIYEFAWNNKKINIAIYTEPSVYWERSNKLCRSWNFMSDGTVYASLEDKTSLITLK